MAEPYLWCPKCKKRVEKIIEEYLEPIYEERVWNGEEYELEGSNLSESEVKQLCGECEEKLEEIK